MLTQDEAIVTFTRFKQLVSKHAPKTVVFQPRELDCVFLHLLKGGAHDISNLSEAQLADRTRGFDSQSIERLFPGIDIDEITSTAGLTGAGAAAGGGGAGPSRDSLGVKNSQLPPRDYTEDRSSLGFDMQPSMEPAEVLRLKQERGLLPLPGAASPNGKPKAVPKPDVRLTAAKAAAPQASLESSRLVSSLENNKLVVIHDSRSDENALMLGGGSFQSREQAGANFATTGDFQPRLQVDVSAAAEGANHTGDSLKTSIYDTVSHHHLAQNQKESPFPDPMKRKNVTFVSASKD